jgi:hypothetical protein
MIKGMTDQWIVRVEGREYGPADIETLREWKREGRLLPENEARNTGADFWGTAATIPGLFDAGVGVPTEVPVTQPPLQRERRRFREILGETFQIYRKGFLKFLCLTLLVLLPSICSQVATAVTQGPKGSDADLRMLAAGSFALLMFVLSKVMWPVYVAGIQILTAEMAGGQRPSLLDVLNRAVRFWPRIAALCIFVYGVFFLLMLFGLVIAAIALAGTSSLLLIFLALALLVLQVWMFGRFFINVLFWQQFAVLENAEFIDSLRESRNLARSGRDLPWFQRPLWRGAFIVSIWFAFVMAISLGSEWPMLQTYFHELTTTQDPQALLQQLSQAQQARGFDAVSFSLHIFQGILQPMLGIAFVVLYLDSKLERE